MADSMERSDGNMPAAADDEHLPTSSVASTGGGTDLFFSDATFKEELAKLVAVKQLSFDFGAHLLFENHSKTLNPAARRVRRAELERTTKKLYTKGKKDLIKLFANVHNKVSVCCDIWSDHWERFSYISISCYWIDDSWSMQKRLLAFRALDEMHAAENLSQVIILVLEEYHLKNKVFSISINNASSNATNVEDLKRICESSVGCKFIHIICMCHVLNLCVQDVLTYLDNHINPVKHALDCIFSHSQVMNHWIDFCKSNSMRPKTFSRDIPTRWNSTYLLLQQSYQYKELLCSFFMQNFNDVHLFPAHWVVCDKIYEILKTFNGATLELSRVYHPTTHLVLSNYCDVALILNEYSSDEILKYCAEKMKCKWKKYFLDIPDISLVASVLDPRVKLDSLQEMLTFYYDTLIPTKDNDSPNPATIVNSIKTYLYDIYNEYNLNRRRTIESQNATSSSRLSRGRLTMRERMKRFRESLGATNHEIENYLSTVFEFNEADFEEFDILRWWSQRIYQFPVLSLMAKDILACPASTVAADQVFNTRGNILSEERSLMFPDSLEAQTCLGDWTQAEYRMQNLQVSDGEEDDLETDGNTISEEAEDSD